MHGTRGGAWVRSAGASRDAWCRQVIREVGIDNPADLTKTAVATGDAGLE
jgi:hypothetical protein